MKTKQEKCSVIQYISELEEDRQIVKRLEEELEKICNKIGLMLPATPANWLVAERDLLQKILDGEK